MDIAIDFRTGDLLLTANRDFAGISGPDEIVQRIHMRLVIERGTWLDDPSDGQLGSRLGDLSGMKAGRAIGEADVLIREALAPMQDIIIEDVVVEMNEDERTLEAHITYRDIQDPNESEIDTTSTISMPLVRT